MLCSNIFVECQYAHFFKSCVRIHMDRAHPISILPVRPLTFQKTSASSNALSSPSPSSKGSDVLKESVDAHNSGNVAASFLGVDTVNIPQGQTASAPAPESCPAPSANSPENATGPEQETPVSRSAPVPDKGCSEMPMVVHVNANANANTSGPTGSAHADSSQQSPTNLHAATDRASAPTQGARNPG